jgi:hypothetical protein
MDFYSIMVERFMYFLWKHIPLDVIPVEITFFAVLIAFTVALFAIFVFAVVLWQKMLSNFG